MRFIICLTKPGMLASANGLRDKGIFGLCPRVVLPPPQHLRISQGMGRENVVHRSHLRKDPPKSKNTCDHVFFTRALASFMKVERRPFNTSKKSLPSRRKKSDGRLQPPLVAVAGPANCLRSVVVAIGDEWTGYSSDAECSLSKRLKNCS